MKKIINILVLIYIIVTPFLLFSRKTTNEILSVDKSENINMLSMMLETEAGSGKYKETTANSWPTDGYNFNAELSRCEQGSSLSWNDNTKKVIMEGNSADKCYIYFNKIPDSSNLSNFIKSLFTGVQGENNIYYHNGTIKDDDGTVLDANDNSYRYAGSSGSVNNFVCFGYDNVEDNCNTDNLYRIIGVFNDRIKLIKFDFANSDLLGTDGAYAGKWTAGLYDYYEGSKSFINTYKWNGNTNSNNWNISYLNTINLNVNYLNSIGNEWSKMIDVTNWQVGGNTYTNILSEVNLVYNYEILNPATNLLYESKIGLIYVSDYGYAAVPSSWNTSVYDYGKLTSWIYFGENFLTITRKFNDNSDFYLVTRKGAISYYSVSDGYGVRPAFYLNSSVKILNNVGDGSKNNPYKIFLFN